MSSSDIEVMTDVLAQTEGTIAGVGPDQASAPTPCTEFDVAHLLDHVVGWARSFAARLSGDADEVDPAGVRAGAAPATEFHESAGRIIAAYREGTEASATLPPGFIALEFLTHGWDLAAATGQTPAFSAEGAELALATAQGMLKPEYRGPGMSFGPEVAVGADAGPVERLVAFMGRDPRWRADA